METLHIHQNKKPAKKQRSEAVTRAQHKYYEKNKEQIKKNTHEYHKIWNIKKKMCSCGMEIKNYSWAKHAKSQKHMKRINNMRDT